MTTGVGSLVVLLLLGATALAGCSNDGSTTEVTSTPTPDPQVPASPQPQATWQYQLTGQLDLTVDADVYDIDGDRTTSDDVAALHRRGVYVVCYLSAGSWEEWRDDAATFPPGVLGRPLDGWSDERWLDVRRLDLIAPIIEARLDACSAKGFDAVEFDNVDGWTYDTGFPITADDQLAFNRSLAAAAHRRGLDAGLKNDGEQVEDLVDDFDFAVVEECVRYDECSLWHPFADAGKAMFVVEYEGEADQICEAVQALGAHAIVKDLDLGPARLPC